MERDEFPRARPVPSGVGRTWPPWAMVLMSAALLYHMAAILAGAMAAPPSSVVERKVGMLFQVYHDVINQGYAYRYYSRLDMTADPRDPHPWGTPVITAEMEFDRSGGATTREEVRLPDRRRPWPGLRHQRRLDLAYHLAADPCWAASYARHLTTTRGCTRVTIFAQEHRIPDLALARQSAAGRGTPVVDLEAESTYGPRVKLGEFRCTDF